MLGISGRHSLRPKTQNTFFEMVAGVVDRYKISSIFKVSECSVGFPHPTEKNEAENNVGRFARRCRI